MRVAQRILVACLICLPAVAFADVYPLDPPPDLFIDTFTSTGSMVTATVESITDLGNCSAIPCTALSPTTLNLLDFYQNSNSFIVSDGPDGTGNIYLAGTEIASKVEAGGEVGEIFDITTDNNALWSTLEGQPASSFGPDVVMDLHDFYFGNGSEPLATADMTPAPVPEPASLTLLLSGLAAGYVRKRRAGKKP